MSGPSQKIPSKIGPFHIEKKLGHGGSSVVFLGKTSSGKIAAIKLLDHWIAPDEQSRNRFLREIKQNRTFQDPRLVKIYGAGSFQGNPYFSMEYVSGPTLDDFLNHQGELPFKDVLRVIEETLLGLEVLHKENVVHRDLKPGNLFLTGPLKKVKIGDFGLAKQVNDLDLTLDNQRIGTPAYMSPEQCKGGSLTLAADIYQMGILSYRLALGRVPFEGNNFFKLSMKHLASAPPSMRTDFPEIPEEFEYFVFCALEKRPKRRFQNASQMLKSLREVKETIRSQPDKAGLIG